MQNDDAKQTTQELNESFGNYLVEHTQKNISTGDDLVFRFSGSVVDIDQIGSDLDNSSYSIRPEVEGRAYWSDQSTLIFTHEKPLADNENYLFTIQLEDLYTDVPDGMKKVTIPFQTSPLSFSIQFNNINYGSLSDDYVNLSGIIKSSNPVENEAIEKMLSASLGSSNTLPILWNHTNRTNHSFEITKIERKSQPTDLSINYSDPTFGTNFKGKKSFTIYPKEAFRVVDITPSQLSQNALTVHFTSSLNPNQDLTGLIQVLDYSGKTRYDVDGNKVHFYILDKIISPFTVSVNKSIKDRDKSPLTQSFEKVVSLDPIKPQVKLSGKGVIVPHGDNIIFPFEAINLNGVTVEIFKIFENNVLQFLQTNSLNDDYGMHPVGRVVHQQKINLLDINPESNQDQFLRYALDLSPMVQDDPGAIYQVRIGFSKENVVNYPCSESINTNDEEVLLEKDGFVSILRNNYYPDYSWSDRDNPCKGAYYFSHRIISRNVLASNIGVIAKTGSDNIHFSLTDLRNLNALNAAKIQLFDYQKQSLGTISTDAKGSAVFNYERRPSFAIIKHQGDISYIDLDRNKANSLSEFDVSGKQIKNDINGYLYAERGVHRPGDTVFLDFILEDKKQSLPPDHPVKIVVKDSRGKTRFEKTTANHINHVYGFQIPTRENDPTGNWSAIVTVGQNSFQKTLKIETVKPNRLKINIGIDEDENVTLYKETQIPISSNWLHGAPASDLIAKVNVQLRPTSTKFSKHSSYRFDDPARKVDAKPFTVYDKKLDENGQGTMTIDPIKNWNPPGKVTAVFNTKVFEKGGNFSEDNFQLNADYYPAYVGINVPKNRWGSKAVDLNTETNIPLISVDKAGNPLGNRKLKIGLYRANWRWWYDNGYNQRFNYNSANHNGAIETKEITTDSNGKANYAVNFSNYGNYMIRVCDEEGGHCTGELFYSGRYWKSDASDVPQTLSFETDKSSYTVKEDIEVKIPSNENSKIFLSIESGENVLQAFWIDGEKDQTVVNIPADQEMTPNIYIHAMLIQPHNHGENDLPLRMFGIVPVKVVDPSTELHPVIKMDDKLTPDKDFTVTISEADGQHMTYTLAVVDEGLLDLTRFKTPDPWSHFYSKQALGVSTHDLYDYVLNGYGGEINRYISIGGDDVATPDPSATKVNRFDPVVMHFGPFYLPKGKKQNHTLNMPNYVGSVRTMVVARNGEAYGNEDFTTPVKKPLMLQATLPRVIAPKETVLIPANVFAMEDNIKNVDVSIKTSDHFNISNATSTTLKFDKQGDQQAYFNATIGENTGMAYAEILAKSGSQTASDRINIEVINPNPYTTEVQEISLQPGETWNQTYELFGTPGTNEAALEISNIQPFNLEKRLRYLIRYPYGCIEQTTSSAFPQLYLNDIVQLTPQQVRNTSNNIKLAIERLSLFQLNNGGFSYWPGSTNISRWGTNFAGHFLLEAKEKGYYINETMLKSLLKYQDAEADQFNTVKRSNEDYIDQAYRLYTLALGGNPNIGAMNRLKNVDKLPTAANHLLAAAYAMIGKTDVAKAMIASTNVTVTTYSSPGLTFGSQTRDLAIAADVQRMLGMERETAENIKTIAERMNSRSWYSTQTTAFALTTLGKYFMKYAKGDLTFNYSTNGGQQNTITSKNPIFRTAFDVESAADKKVNVTNTSQQPIYVKLIRSGKKPPGNIEEPFNKFLDLKVTYTDIQGVPINVSKLKIGTDFIAKVEINKLAGKGQYKHEMALVQNFPSGWEINNDRLNGTKFSGESSYDYRDIRDSKVYTFFDLRGTEKRTYYVQLTASYAGRFYFPPVLAEAMYENEIQAQTNSQWVEVSTQNVSED